MNTTQRIRSLDGLRAIAIALVLGHHFFSLLSFRGKEYVAGFLTGGWAGVDLFLVLSGFLVSRVVMRNHRAENFLRVFYARRALRILVPYYLLLLYSYLCLRAFSFSTDIITWPVFILHLQTLWFGWNDQWTVHFLNPTWTLGLEEYFYLILPMFLLRQGRKAVVPFAVIGLALGVLGRFAIATYRPTSSVAYYIWRPDGLLWGMLIAAAMESPMIREKMHQWRSIFFAVALVLTASLLSFFWDSKDIHSPEQPANAWLYPCVPFACALWVCVVLTSKENSWTQKILANRPMVYIGTISYSIYLYHELVHFLGNRAGLSSGVHAAAMVLISVGIAALSWRVLERHLIAYGHRLTYSAPSNHPSNTQHRSSKDIRATG
jgi:peptidoglycan/LPS O-acetylase OafA/YrhL